MAESLIESLVFALALIAGLVTLSLPWLAIDWWTANQSAEDHDADESDDS
ncbi:hypothetical protein [Natronorubrum bangense]|nr:hypothetical protein [Natronorubrum bangense]